MAVLNPTGFEFRRVLFASGLFKVKDELSVFYHFFCHVLDIRVSQKEAVRDRSSTVFRPHIS